MSSEPVYGAVASVATSVHVPAPAGERWKVTVLTVPGAVSDAVAASATAAPRRFAAATGAVSEPLGRIRSMVIRTSSVFCLPALSVARTRRRRGPSDGIGQDAWYGAPVSRPSRTHESETHAGESSAHWSKRTFAIPLPSSVAVALTVAGSAVARLTGFGATTESAGSVLSTVTVIVGEVNVLPASSVVRTRRS